VQAHAHADERVDEPLLDDTEAAADPDALRVEGRGLDQSEGRQEHARDDAFWSLGHQTAHLMALDHREAFDSRG
jgi:hypothetical protein